jgi:hypothetical protein
MFLLKQQDLNTCKQRKRRETEDEKAQIKKWCKLARSVRAKKRKISPWCTVLWEATPCSSVYGFQRFGRTSCLHLVRPSSMQKSWGEIEAAGFRMKRLVCTRLHGIMLQNITDPIFRLSPESTMSLQTFTSVIQKHVMAENLNLVHFNLVLKM